MRMRVDRVFTEQKLLCWVAHAELQYWMGHDLLRRQGGAVINL